MTCHCHTLDLRECDASHHRGDMILRGLLLKALLPEARILRLAYLALASTAAARWRARTVKLVQPADFWSALMSGLPDTFMRNCIKMLGVAGTLKLAIAFMIVGGDDLALGTFDLKAPNFNLAGQLGNIVTLERTAVGEFWFHFRIVDKHGSHPDICKVAGKVLDRRFVRPKHCVHDEVRAYIVSVRDQLAGMTSAETPAKSCKANKAPIEAAETCYDFLASYASSQPEQVFVLETDMPLADFCPSDSKAHGLFRAS